jgi:hypothetical protein
VVKAAGPPSRLRAALAAAPPAVALLLLAAAVLAGGLALQALRGQPRYQIRFSDIDCTPPPGVSREQFLDDVQYLAGLPDSACVLDESLPGRLSAAFAKYPWVERVDGVDVAAPRKVRVRLTYRTAVLRVPDHGGMSAVDALGVRLPDAAAAESLPLLAGDIKPAGQEGRPWGDARVAAAARTAGLLGPYQDQLRLKFIEATDGGLVLRGHRRVIRWGAAPSSEPPGEPTADVKLRRLLEYAARHADEPWEADVRAAP